MSGSQNSYLSDNSDDGFSTAASKYSPSASSSGSSRPSLSGPRSGSRSVSRAPPPSSPPTPASSPKTRRAEFSRYTHLLSSLAARDAENLALRLSGSGVWADWSSPRTIPSSPPSRYRIGPSSDAPCAPGDPAYEISDNESDVSDELFPPEPVDSAGPSAGVDPSTRWPLHPAELVELRDPLSTLTAINECAERTLRRGHFVIKDNNLASPLAHHSGSQEDTEAAIPSELPARVVEALDRTLAGLVAFRPRKTLTGRKGSMGWEAVLSAAAMGVDRIVLERTAARLGGLFPARAGTPALSEHVLSRRLDLVDEATGPPRADPQDIAHALYTLPPLKAARRKGGVLVGRPKKDAAERAEVARQFAARRVDKKRKKEEEEHKKQKTRRSRNASSTPASTIDTQ